MNRSAGDKVGSPLNGPKNWILNYRNSLSARKVFVHVHYDQRRHRLLRYLRCATRGLSEVLPGQTS